MDSFSSRNTSRTAMINGSSTSLQLFQWIKASVPQVDQQPLRLIPPCAEAWVEWAHPLAPGSTPGIYHLRKDMDAKVTWMISKVWEKNWTFSSPYYFKFTFAVYSSYIPNFPTSWESFSIPFFEALPAAVWNALDPWRRFPRNASRNFAAVTSIEIAVLSHNLATWSFSKIEKTHTKPTEKKNRNSPKHSKRKFEPAAAPELHSLIKTNSLVGRPKCLLGKPISRGYVCFRKGIYIYLYMM